VGYRAAPCGPAAPSPARCRSASSRRSENDRKSSCPRSGPTSVGVYHLERRPRRLV
jgi:hypothetical protein